jgi:hypothetical protein
MERYSLETIETFFFFFFFFLKWKTFFSSNTIDSLFNYSNLSFIEERPPSFLLITPMIGTVFPGPWRVEGKGIAYYQVYLFYSFWWFCSFSNTVNSDDNRCLSFLKWLLLRKRVKLGNTERWLKKVNLMFYIILFFFFFFFFFF